MYRPVLHRVVLHRLRGPAVPRTVDQRVDLAECREARRHQALDVVLPRQVSGEGDGPIPGLVHLGGRLLHEIRGPRRTDDAGALAAEAQGQRPADALRRPEVMMATLPSSMPMVAPHRPWNDGGRLSTKARMPSRASSVSKQMFWAKVSNSSACRRSHSGCGRSRAWRAGWPRADRRRSCAPARARRASAPRARAPRSRCRGAAPPSASMISPVKISSARLGHADHARQEVRPAPVRMQAAPHEGLGELGRRRGQADVAGERQVHAGPRRRAIDGGDDRLAAHRAAPARSGRGRERPSPRAGARRPGSCARSWP